jgi:hypothetical protein
MRELTMARSEYQINQPVHEVRHRRYRRWTRLLLFLLLVCVAAVAILAFYLFHYQHAGDKSAIGANYSQKIAGPQTFKSSYFQFSDTSNWVYAPNDSTANKLTYLLYEAGVPAHSLTVYINQTPLQTDLAVTRALPVQIVNGNAFSVGSLSAPCSTAYAPAAPKVIKPVLIGGTSILCVPDSPEYLVAVGQQGGDYNLTLKRSDGETAQYIIIYHNLSIDPDPSPFLRIMQTFKAL